MNKRRNRRILVFICGVSVAAWAFAQGVIQADKLEYNAPRTHYYTVGPPDFNPATSGIEFARNSIGAYLLQSSGAFAVPLHLPQGAVITEMRAYVYDNYFVSNISNGNLTIEIRRMPYSIDSEDLLASVESSGFPGFMDYADTTINFPVIDNLDFSYWLRVTADTWPGDPDLRIKGVVVTYTIAEAD